MRTLRLGCVLAAALAAGGCFQMTTTVMVKGDGSGTIDHSMLVTKAALAQLRSFAALAGGGAGPSELNLFSEDQAREMAGALGEGVSYVASEPVDTPLATGRRSTYSFADIGTIRISQRPQAPAGVPFDSRGFADGDITCSLTRETNGNAIVHIQLPELQKPPLAPTSASPAQDANPFAQQLAMVRGLLAGAHVAIAIEPAGQLVRTNSAWVEGGRVILLEVDLDQLLANDAALTRLKQAQSREELKEALKDVPGLKIPLEREITVEFTPDR